MHKSLTLKFLSLLLLSTSSPILPSDPTISLNNEGKAFITVAKFKEAGPAYGLPEELPESPPVNLPLKNIYHDPDREQFVTLNGKCLTLITPGLASLLRQKNTIHLRIQELRRVAALAKKPRVPKKPAAKNTPFVGAIAPIAYNNNKPYVLLASPGNEQYGLIETYNDLHVVSHTAMHKAFNQATGYIYGLPAGERNSALAYLESIPKEGAYNSSNSNNRRIFPKKVHHFSTKKLNKDNRPGTLNLRWISLSKIQGLAIEGEGHYPDIKLDKQTIIIDPQTVNDLQHPSLKFSRKKKQ